MKADPNWLREEAQRCFRLARTINHPEVARQLEARGRELEERARALEQGRKLHD